MPAATIVAAWMSADTGVGPSIASGSQTCSGICADLPIAPQNRSNGIHLLHGITPPSIAAFSSERLTVLRQ